MVQMVEAANMVKNTRSSAHVSGSQGDIARRAYELYVERGRSDGFDLDDWLRAERELRTAPSAAPRRASTRDASTAKDRQL
jgi:DUF2934 family protein